MFADYIKMAAKVALIALISTAIIALFASVTLPAPDFSAVYNATGKALAIINYWFPLLGQLWTLCLGLMGLRISIYVFEFAMIAYRWIMKVNE